MRKKDPINSKRRQENCKFFLKGACSYGDNCIFFHAPQTEKLIKPSEFVLQTDFSKFKVDPTELKLYNINLDIPFDFVERKTHGVLMIRHGLSKYNLASSEFFNQTGLAFSHPGAKVYQTNPALIDSDLHPYGELMAKNNGKYLRNIEFAVVFVSPLARALQTARLMFENHPNRKNIKFIVRPEFSEILSKVQDISDIQKQINRYQDEFDFSQMQAIYGDQLHYWQAINIHDEGRRNYVLNGDSHDEAEEDGGEKGDNDEEKSQSEEGEQKSLKSTVQDRILEMMDQVFPSALEKMNMTFERASAAKEVIRQYVLEHKVNTKLYKIGIVSHNAFIQNFTAPGITDDGFVVRGKAMDNCEIKPLEFQ